MKFASPEELKNIKKPVKISTKHKLLLEIVENMYFEGLEDKSHVTQMEIKNGKVIIPLEMPHHSIPVKNISELESYSDMGIIATEWFGELEAENEGRLCTFVSKGYFLQGKGLIPAGICSENDITFYIDENNEYWKKISQYDFFEYEHIKNTTPEKLKELYPPEIIDLYDELVEPLSPGGKRKHDHPLRNTSIWMAIPGGIPPQLIVGIQCHKNSLKKIGNLDEIQKLFPNAVIFDENHFVYQKEKSLENQEYNNEKL